MTAPWIMLRTVKSDGTLDQYLPDYVSLEVSPVFSSVGTVTFNYPENGKNFALLADDIEIAVIISGTEVGSVRCIIESSSGDDADEAQNGAIWSYTCRTMMALFDRAVVYPKNWPSPQPPTHDFIGASIGKILRSLVAKAQARGALTGVTLDFSDTLDSADQPWAMDYDLTYDAGITYSEVIQNMVDGVMAEFEMDRRILKAYNPNTLGVDRSAGANPLRFHKGRDLKDSPRKSSTRELGTVVLASGDNNSYAERSSDAATMSQWGRREWYFSASGIPNKDFVDYVASKVLDSRNRPLLEVTHGLHFEADENPRPVRDFVVGDWGLTDVGRGWERYRIKQWVMSVSNSGEITGSVTMNDLIAEQLEKLNKKISMISGGLTGTGSSEETDDGKPPAQTSHIDLGTDYYIDGGGISRAIVTVDWAPVTTNSDGTPLDDLAQYRVRWKYTGDSTWRAYINLDSDETETQLLPVDTNRQIQVQVQTIDKWGHGSGYTPSNFVTTAQDTVAPAKPAPPVVTSNVGTLRVTWSGLDYLGQQMAPDFKGVEVHLGTSASFTPSAATQKDYLTARSNTATTITGLTYGTEYWVKLVASDTTGNKSPASDNTSTSHAILAPVVNVEIGTGQIGLGNIRFSDIGNLVEDGSFENSDARDARTPAFAGTHMAFANDTSSNGFWSLKFSPVAISSVESAILQSGLPAKPGERFFGAADFRVSATASAAATVQVVLWFYDKNGVILDPVTGAPGTFSTAHAILASSFNQAPHDDAWYPRVTLASKTAPANTASVSAGVRIFTLYTGNVWMDALEIRRQVDTLMVADAAIGNAQIKDLAVNNAKIADLSVGKLTTGTLSADIVVGARIKTADSGARAEMNSGGFGLWNSSEVQTLYASSATGEVRIKGQLVSEFSGRRVEINPTATQLPEIRFYPTSGSNYGYLNAIDGGSGNEVSVGLNSGSFTGNGALSQYRLYLTNSSGGASLSTINSSSQAFNGGYVLVDPVRALMGVNISGRSHGFVETFSEASGDISARIGHDGSTTATDCWTLYADNGQIETIGRFEDGFGPYNNSALHAYTMDFANSIGSVVWSWGVTTLTRLYPITQVRDQGAHGAGMNQCSTTGFELTYDTVTSGGSSLHWLAYRGS